MSIVYRDANFYKKTEKPTADTPERVVSVDEPMFTVSATGARSASMGNVWLSGGVHLPPKLLLIDEPTDSPIFQELNHERNAGDGSEG